MGFWNDAGRALGRVVREAAGTRPEGAAGRGSSPPSRREVPEALRGPDPGTLVTVEDLERATGSRPVGEGDRKSGGQDLDTGWFRVCIWSLADGGELLLNTTRLRDDAGVALWRSRWDDPGWRDVDDERPLEGVGETGRWYVTSSPKGGTERHATAKDGWYVVQLVHTSPAGGRDIGPLTDLLRTVLSRLRAS